MSANFIYLWFVLYYSILEQLKLYNGRGILHGPSKNLATVYLAAFFRSFSQPHKCLMIYWLSLRPLLFFKLLWPFLV